MEGFSCCICTRLWACTVHGLLHGCMALCHAKCDKRAGHCIHGMYPTPPNHDHHWLDSALSRGRCCRTAGVRAILNPCTSVHVGRWVAAAVDSVRRFTSRAAPPPQTCMGPTARGRTLFCMGGVDLVSMCCLQFCPNQPSFAAAVLVLAWHAASHAATRQLLPPAALLQGVKPVPSA